jgi:hypothetical protein
MIFIVNRIIFGNNIIFIEICNNIFEGLEIINNLVLNPCFLIRISEKEDYFERLLYYKSVENMLKSEEIEMDELSPGSYALKKSDKQFGIFYYINSNYKLDYSKLTNI